MDLKAQAREQIDVQLTASGWAVQGRDRISLGAVPKEVREFQLQTEAADFLLFVDRNAVGSTEAESEGTTLLGVAERPAKHYFRLADPRRRWIFVSYCLESLIT